MPTEVLRSDTFEQWRVKTNTIGSDLGTKADLSANITANTSLVTAINELQSDIGVIGSLTNFTATNIVAGLNELRSSPTTLTGDITGSGIGSISTTLANTGVVAGTYNTVVVNAKGLVTSGNNSSVGTFSGLAVSSTSNLGATIISGPNAETDVLTIRNASAADKFTVDTLGNVFISGNLQVVGTTSIAASNLTLEWTDILNKPDPVITVNLTGAITGSGNTTLTDLASGTIAINTTIATNSITLGTQTAGDYVAAVTGNGEAVVTGGTGEGSTAALSIGSAIARRADTTFIGTTSIALNRSSGNQALTGISSITLPGATSGTVQIIPTAAVGTGTILTIPATTGTVITSGDTGTVTNTMLSGGIANAKLTNSAVTVTAGSGLTGGGAVSLGGSVTLTHGSVSAAASVDNSGGNVIQDLTFDSFGHVTGTASVNLDSRYLQTESDTLNSVVGRGATTATAITVGGVTTTGTVATGVLTTTGNATVGGTLNVTGDLVVSGSSTVINTETINLADNNIVLNSNYVGNTPTENCGITVNRGGGTAPSKILEWNENTDKWSVGSETFVAGSFEGNLTGNAATASSAAKLTNARTINGVSFDGTTNITIPSTTSGALTVGAGIVFASGSSFDGSVARQISIDGTVVATLTGSQALTSKTYNGLSLSALSTGFSVAGGTTSKTLTVSNTLTLAASNDTSTLNIGTGGTLGSAAFTAASAYATAAQGTKADNVAAVGGIVNSNGDGTFTSVTTTTSVQFGSLGIGTAASGTTGEIRATNNITAYYSSDERLKTNVRKIQGALESVSKIDGVIYDWNETYLADHGDVDGYFVRQDNSGVIAQQVEKVFPHVVADREDGYKAVRYELLVPLLIEAIKELKAEIEVLKAR